MVNKLSNKNSYFILTISLQMLNETHYVPTTDTIDRQRLWRNIKIQSKQIKKSARFYRQAKIIKDTNDSTVITLLDNKTDKHETIHKMEEDTKTVDKLNLKTTLASKNTFFFFFITAKKLANL